MCVLYIVDKNQIRQIVYDHQKLFGLLNYKIKRDIDISSYLNSNQIIVITGIRRSGKSTLLKAFEESISKKIVYLKFDDIRLADFSDIQKLEEVVFEEFGTDIYFAFDEIQELTNWQKWVNGLHARNYKVFVTGSNAKLLSSELATYLTGRHKKITLYPLSFAEIIRYNNISLINTSTEEKGALLALFKDYFENGGFPDVYLTKDFSLLSSYVEDIMLKDIVQRHNIKQKKELVELLTYLLSNSGKLYSYRSLKQITNISSFSTIKNYLEAICETYLLFSLAKYDSSLKKQYVSSSKMYVIDPGLLQHVAFRVSENSGRILENIVCIQLKRLEKELYYHKDKHECDFVIKEGLKITQAIQVCYDLHSDNKKREIDGLLEACQTHNLKQGLLLTYDQEEDFIQDNVKIQVKPVWKWLLEGISSK